MNKVTANFNEQTIFVGLDVHKRSWNAALFLNDQYLRNVHQPPSPHTLYKYLSTNYPGATYVCAYESGKFGYWIIDNSIAKESNALSLIPPIFLLHIKMK